MARTSLKVFESHQRAFGSGDLDLLLADYADDAIMVTMDGPAVGKEAIQGKYQYFFTGFPSLGWALRKLSLKTTSFL